MGMVTQKKKKIEIPFKSIILIEQNLQVEIFLKRKESQYESKQSEASRNWNAIRVADIETCRGTRIKTMYMIVATPPCVTN